MDVGLIFSDRVIDLTKGIPRDLCEIYRHDLIATDKIYIRHLKIMSQARGIHWKGQRPNRAAIFEPEHISLKYYNWLYRSVFPSLARDCEIAIVKPDGQEFLYNVQSFLKMLNTALKPKEKTYE